MSLDRKINFVLWMIIGAASLLTGCGFRQYERVAQTDSARTEPTAVESGLSAGEKEKTDSEISLQQNGEAEMPARENDATGVEISIGSEQISIGKEQISTGKDQVSTGEEQVSIGDNQVLSRDDQVSTGDGQESGIEIRIDQEELQTEDTQIGDVTGDDAARAADQEDDTDTVTMLFAGDIYLSEYVLEAYDKAGGVSGVLDAAYRQEIQNADIFFANEEFPFSDRGEQAADKQYTFRLPVERAAIFQELGIDGVTLANNHALDYGRTALLDTIETLDRVEIQHTGAGENLEAAMQPAVFTVSDRKIAVVGATRVIPQADWAAGTSWTGMLSAYDPSTLLSQVRALSQSGEYQAVVAYVHWGIERDEMPQDYQRAMGRQLIDAGADLVIGAHPHVLQGIEYYQGRPIVYSLGNFIFGSSIPRTALLKVTWDGETSPALTLLPGTSASGYTRMMIEESKKAEFFQYMEKISDGICLEDDGTIQVTSMPRTALCGMVPGT